MNQQFPVALPGAKTRTLMWAHEHEIEPQAVQQIRAVGALPWVDELRVMPDVHLGVGATIGTVIGSTSAICPSAVGVDIGCGVNAVKTNLTLEDVHNDLHELRLAIEKAVPVAFHGHDAAVKVPNSVIGGWDTFWGNFRYLHEGVQKNESKAMKQLGSLGSGNHFIELTTDSQNVIWITLHSGSRNIGKELAERHIEIAKTLPHNQDLPIRELAVFLKGSPEMDAYRRDLTWAQEYAMRSRTVMMHLIKEELRKHFAKKDRTITFEDEINCHHNYIAEETHLGKEMIVTRKGAISARGGELALIPGSMATGSYIVRGLGNEDSLTSASHGAGRKMSRGEAKRRFTVEDLKESMVGIEFKETEGVIDEITHAYKSIHDVVEAQSDLVEVVEHLQTILCVKG